MARCRSCGAEITWAVNPSGRREPLDAEPVENGNIEITGTVTDDGEYTLTIRHLKKGEGDLTLIEPPPRYVSHFATCPHAASHRRRDDQQNR